MTADFSPMFKAFVTGLVRAVGATALYLSAVIAFPGLPQPPPLFGFEAVVTFIVGFQWTKRRQRRRLA